MEGSGKVWLALALVAAWAGWLLWRRSRAAGLPPGPWGLPVLGYLPWLDRARPHETLTALADRFGPIFTVPMGGVRAVVLADEALVRAALATEACSGRAPLYLTHGLMQGHGLICAEGPMWREQRRVVASALKNLGAVRAAGPRRDRLQARIQVGVRALLQSLSSAAAEAEAVDPHGHLTEALGNVVNAVVFGRTWAPDDSTWLWLQRIQDEGTKLIGVAGALNFLPFLRLLPQNGRAIRWLKEGQRDQHALYAGLVVEARSTLQPLADEEHPGERPEVDNLLAAWLQEASQRPDSPFYTDKQLHHLLADLFGAALDTTVTTLRWLLLFLAAHPDAQEHVHRELDDVLGGREPTLEDQPALPYTTATIMEAQRIRSVTPLGIPHGVRETTTLAGYTIPKGTMLIPLQWAIHLDPRRWDRPDEFRPERFLSDEGSVIKPDGFIPFQTGKRMCVGDEWARMMLFLFTAGLLQRLHFSAPDGQRVDLDGVCGITLTPKDQRLRCVERTLACRPAPAPQHR